MSAEADLLRRAAALVRERAGKAIDGPWESLDRGDRLVAWRVGPGGFDDDFEYVVDEPISHEGNAEWIALMGPQVAEPVAAFLDGMAVRANWGDSSDFAVDYALAMARALLGEEVPSPTTSTT